MSTGRGKLSKLQVIHHTFQCEMPLDKGDRSEEPDGEAGVFELGCVMKSREELLGLERQELTAAPTLTDVWELGWRAYVPNYEDALPGKPEHAGKLLFHWICCGQIVLEWILIRQTHLQRRKEPG